jgi:hypothetical protein
LDRQEFHYEIVQGHILTNAEGIPMIIGVNPNTEIIFMQVPLRPGAGMEGYRAAKPENEANAALYMLAANYRLLLGGFTRDIDGEIRYESSIILKGGVLGDEQVIAAMAVAAAAVMQHAPVIDALLGGRVSLSQAQAQLDGPRRTVQTA